MDLQTGQKLRIRMTEGADTAQLECAQTAPLVRFDAESFVDRAEVVGVPIAVRLPRIGVMGISVGEAHVAALTATGEVFEWGQRSVLRTHTVTVTRQSDGCEYKDTLVDDLGLVYIATPVRVHGLTACTEVQASHDQTMVLKPPTISSTIYEEMAVGNVERSEQVCLTWTFVEIP